MKPILFLIIFVLGTSITLAQIKQPNLKITGTVKEIAMQEIYPNTSSALYITYIRLNLKLENKGLMPVIFLQSEPIIEYAEVVKTEQTADNFLAKTDGASSSYMMTQTEWENLKASLNKSIPPKVNTRILLPNESFEFEGFVRLNIPKTQDYPQNSIFRENSTLDLIQKNSSAKIKLRLETWSTLSLVKNGPLTEAKKKEFVKKLKNKWKNFGYLWADEIEAEPISIDFNSIIFKTLLN